ncbi:MAG: hypothetical protein V1894_01360 [Chloroflexota bacterium]
MAEKVIGGFSRGDIAFLLETVDPRLLARIDTISFDPVIIEKILSQETDKLFRRIMLADDILARISPLFFFEVSLRKALADLRTRSYTLERTGSQKIPVFDSQKTVEFLSQKKILRYLSEMLTSFTRIESYTRRLRVRKGIWRRVRFSEMDLDSLIMQAEASDEEHRFVFYKRAADLCLFMLGMFPEHVSPDFSFSSGDKPRLFLGSRRSAEDYELEGRRFYGLAAAHRTAAVLGLVEVFSQLYQNFNLARKPLNYLAEDILTLSKQRLFRSPG